jgi:hypothetical protein
MKEEPTYQCAYQAPEKDVQQWMDDIKDLIELTKHSTMIIRHKMENRHPLFVQLLGRFITLFMAQQESLLELEGTLNGIMKEFWAVKYGGEKGEA